VSRTPLQRLDPRRPAATFLLLCRQVITDTLTNEISCIGLLQRLPVYPGVSKGLAHSGVRALVSPIYLVAEIVSPGGPLTVGFEITEAASSTVLWSSANRMNYAPGLDRQYVILRPEQFGVSGSMELSIRLRLDGELVIDRPLQIELVSP
jgi:hypothetical protein